MKYYINIVFLLILTNFVFTQNNAAAEEINNKESIYLSVGFGDGNIKINNKILLKDLTNDIVKYLKTKDTTDDLLKSGRFIYKKEDIEKYFDYISFFNDYINENISGKLENISIVKADQKVLSEISKGNFIDIKISEYTEGEYNLIKNRNTIIKLLVKIYEKSSKESFFLLKVDTYFCKSDIEYPTEKMRLKNISEKLSKNILLLIKNYVLKIKK